MLGLYEFVKSWFFKAGLAILLLFAFATCWSSFKASRRKLVVQSSYSKDSFCSKLVVQCYHSVDIYSEQKLISLITILIFRPDCLDWRLKGDSIIPCITQIISLVNMMDLKLQPKPESELMSLVTQIIMLFKSMDLDSQPKPLSELISLFSRKISLDNAKESDSDLDSDSDSDSDSKLDLELKSLFTKTLVLEPELMSLIYQIISVVICKSSSLISLCPQVRVSLENGKFHVVEEVKCRGNQKWECLPGRWECLPGRWEKYRIPREESTYFHCRGCNGKKHENFNKAPLEIKHHLHRKHHLQLVMLRENKTRHCYCCDENLKRIYYYCSLCDFAINMACAKKPSVLSRDHRKWHEHTLALFPRRAFLTCNLCALADVSSPIYMCPPCDFVVHQRCINLPRVIKISRHSHRISFTPFFDQGDWSCGVCRKKIDNDYGGYSCIKDGCSYAAHSRCATQSNVWDGKELEGVPEKEVIEHVEPFVRIREGLIMHFSHHHFLILDKNTGRDYDENKVCQACITPIYFGNFYSCKQCDFILHEECANLSRRIHHPIHPHMLTLGYGNVVRILCSACPWLCTAGLFYECSKEGCFFKLHVQCATISEPQVHESHMHPLFLTSKPKEERRICSVCKKSNHVLTNETFNCIECDFSLCFGCVTLPPQVRYKHDKHVLTLCYGKETSTTTYWCEVCERNIHPEQRFYMCGEYCCVTLHIECCLGQDLYMKPGSSWFQFGKFEKKVHVLLNNQKMNRYMCSFCEKRCPHKVAFRWSGSILCSLICVTDSRERIIQRA